MTELAAHRQVFEPRSTSQGISPKPIAGRNVADVHRPQFNGTDLSNHAAEIALLST